MTDTYYVYKDRDEIQAILDTQGLPPSGKAYTTVPNAKDRVDAIAAAFHCDAMDNKYGDRVFTDRDWNEWHPSRHDVRYNSEQA